MKNHIKKLLGLQHLWVDSLEIKDKEIVVKVRSPRTSASCPCCFKSTTKIHQYHKRLVKHSVWQSRRVVLCLTKKRFYCRKCNKPFSEDIPDIDNKRTTKNYRKILLKDLVRSSLNYVAFDTGASSSVLYSVLQEHQAEQVIDWKQQGSKIVLGVDEHSFSGRRMALTITNITRRHLLTICPDDRTTTFENFLKTSDKQRIAEVCIDMRRSFLNAIKKELPNAKITADKFHVIANANRTLDEIRSVVIGKTHNAKRILMKGREKLTDFEKTKLRFIFEKYENFPSLKQAYFIKEKLRDFYRMRDKEKARMRINQMIVFCEDSDSNYLKVLGGTLKRWREYILNYFDSYSTNAFTEGVHTKIKMIKRVSFGFRNINNYIAKVSLAFAPLLLFGYHTF